ncbi:hypothetical protein [Geomonas ferrireducens]|uniref:hypothetical protein n=1 Tax=Geomonas ferrireducens TaxID=2570227 RepID=UPI00319EB943
MDRYKFYLLLQEGIERFGHSILSFCLLTNHVHLICQWNLGSGLQSFKIGLALANGSPAADTFSWCSLSRHPAG